MALVSHIPNLVSWNMPISKLGSGQVGILQVASDKHISFKPLPTNNMDLASWVAVGITRRLYLKYFDNFILLYKC